MTHRKFLLFALLILSLGGPAQLTSAQERMRIAWAGSTPSNTPIWVADQKGFFKKNGLECGSDCHQCEHHRDPGVADRRIGSHHCTLRHACDLSAGGRRHDHGLDQFAVVHRPHRFTGRHNGTVEQLKGKIGGVNRLGTTSDMTLRLALRRLGIDPEKDTKIIATGENPQRLAALSRNITQFTLLGEPLVREAEKMGFRDLIDIGTLKIPYHVNSVVTRESTIKSRRPLVAKTVRAFTEAIHYIKTEKESTKALIGKNLKTTDPEGLERAYKAYNAAFPEIPTPSWEGRKNAAG